MSLSKVWVELNQSAKKSQLLNNNKGKSPTPIFIQTGTIYGKYKQIFI